MNLMSLTGIDRDLHTIDEIVENKKDASSLLHMMIGLNEAHFFGVDENTILTDMIDFRISLFFNMMDDICKRNTLGVGDYIEIIFDNESYVEGGAIVYQQISRIVSYEELVKALEERDLELEGISSYEELVDTYLNDMDRKYTFSSRIKKM